jgi:hypothetical protein
MASNNTSISRLRKMSNKAVYFELLFRHLLGWTGENHKTTSQDCYFPDRDLKPELPEYDTELYSSRPQCSICHTFREDCHISENLSVASYHETETIN